MQKFSTFAAVAITMLAAGSCSDNDIGPQVTNFTAALSGANEVPADSSKATATASFSVVPAGLLYRVVITTAIDSATAAHIHTGAAGVNGGVVVPLFGGPTTGLAFTGTLAEGVGGVPIGMTLDSLLVLMRSGNAYVNVHTRTHPGGEIRAQVVVQ